MMDWSSSPPSIARCFPTGWRLWGRNISVALFLVALINGIGSSPRENWMMVCVRLVSCGRHDAEWCFIRCGGDLNRISLVWKSITLWRQQKRADDSASARAPKHLVDGLVIISTINRTLLSYGVAIVGAEYISGVIPRGTHQWHRFITPRELDDGLRVAGFIRGAMRLRCGGDLNRKSITLWRQKKRADDLASAWCWSSSTINRGDCGSGLYQWCYSSWQSMASVHHPARIG